LARTSNFSLAASSRANRRAIAGASPLPVFRLASLAVFATLTISSACQSVEPRGSQLRTTTDELGRQIRVASRPGRIVSLAPSITETLFALGVGDRVVGVTTYCNYPPQAASKEKIGDTLRPNIEKIVALQSDLVIVSTASQLEESVKRLDELGIPVYASNPRNIDQVLTSIDKLGELTGAQIEGRRLVQSLRTRIENVEQKLDKARRPSVLFLLGTSPLISAGRGTFVDDLINRAGGRSLTGDLSGDYPQYSLESAIAGKPEVIFLQSGDDQLPARLKDTPAGRSGRVYHLNDDLLLRPGPRVVEGLEQMAACIHPELFREEHSEAK
jgi:iron complex transport system substrate-binding protein